MTPTDPRALRSRQVMLDAAARLLLRGGVQQVTHQSVATEAGVGRATVYRHWPRLTDLLLDALGNAALVVDFGDGNLRAQLLHELGQRLPEINSSVTGALVGVLVSRGDHDEQMHDLRLHVFGRLIDAITEAVIAASDDGQLAAETPARELATMIFGALLLQRSLLGVQLTPEHLERIIDAALHGWWRSP